MYLKRLLHNFEKNRSANIITWAILAKYYTHWFV